VFVLILWLPEYVSYRIVYHQSTPIFTPKSTNEYYMLCTRVLTPQTHPCIVMDMSAATTAVIARKISTANQAEISRALGVSRAYVCLILAGKRRGMGFQVGVKLSRELGVSAEQLHDYLESVPMTNEPVN